MNLSKAVKLQDILVNGIKSLQLSAEMSQRLYLDEITGQKSNDFQKTSVLLQSLLERFSKYMIKVENQK